MPTTCTRCAAHVAPTHRFCPGCGLGRSMLATAVEEVFADPPATSPIPRPRHHTSGDDAVTVGLRPSGPQASVPTASGPPPAAGPAPGPLPTRVWPSAPVTPPPGAAGRHGVPPGPLPPRPASPNDDLGHWAALGTGGLLALVLVVGALVAFPTQSTSGADLSALIMLTMPALAIAAGAVGVVVAIARRSAVAVGAAGALAAVSVTAALWSASDAAPGVLGGTLAVGLVVLLVVLPPRGAMQSSSTAVVLTCWWAGGAVIAGVAGLVLAGNADRPTPSYAVGGVLFLLLAGAGAAVASQLPTGHPGVAATLAGLWLVDAVAVALADKGGHVLWPVLALHAAAAVAAFLDRPTLARLGPDAGAAVGRLRARFRALPRPWVLGGGAGLVAFTGLVLLAVQVSSDSSSSSYSSSGSTTGATVIVVVVGLLSFAAMGTPTMPWFWRVGLGVGGLVALSIAWAGTEDLSRTSHVFTWIVLFPVVLIGGAIWGAVVNHRHGATARRPGWVGPGGPPPARPIPFLVPPTAGGRARLALDVDTGLAPGVVLDAVRRTTAVRGNWFVVQGDHVQVAGADPATVALHIGGHCRFRARVEVRGGRTLLRVGGMDHWLQTRSYYAGVIPAGPGHVQGFFMYKLFLQTVGAEIARLDPHARLAIGGSRS